MKSRFCEKIFHLGDLKIYSDGTYQYARHDILLWNMSCLLSGSLVFHGGTLIYMSGANRERDLEISLGGPLL